MRALSALLLIAAASSAALATDHDFILDAAKITPAPTKVNLAGTFNGWDKGATPLKKEADGKWHVTLQLADDVYHYKFVLDGEHWIKDPAADTSLEDDDGNGGMNSGVLIGFDTRKLPVPPQGTAAADVLAHVPAEDVALASATSFKVGLRMQAGDCTKVEAVVLGADGEHAFDLYQTDVKLGLSRWGGMADFKGDSLHYVFRLTDDGGSVYYTSKGLTKSLEEAKAAPFAHDTVVKFATPDWAKEAVWYQIFPERFRNGDPANDPPHTKKWTSKWFSVLPGETPGMDNFYKGAGNVWQRRYGGDVQGIKQALPYLKKLGVTAIYLNPMFQAESMHKYDTTDYRHIDEFFGVKGDIHKLVGETDDPATWQWTESDKLFLDFVAEAHKQGFKVVLDGVFNHVGTAHPFFQDVVKNGKESRYAGWFDIVQFGDPSQPVGSAGGLQYKAWDKPNGALPILKKDAETGLAHGPYEHVMAVTKRWLAPDGDSSRGIDGWRLDVANDIPHPFWVEWRKVVKAAKSDAYISGEIWSVATPWLKGDEFDGVMNYQFAMTGQRFFVNKVKATTPTQFSIELSRLTNLYPFQSVQALMNLYDSHDTDRLASMFVNPDHDYDQANRNQDNGPEYNAAKPTPVQRLRMLQAAAFQMTFVGSPMIYYGDEAGMWSPDDPSNRQPMVWTDVGPFEDPEVGFNADTFAHYQRYVAIRQAIPALRTGYYHTVLTNDADGIITFARRLGDKQAIVIVNRSANDHKVRVPCGEKVIDWTDPASVDIVNLDGVGGRPKAVPKPDATLPMAAPGIVEVRVPAWGVTILAPANP